MSDVDLLSVKCGCGHTIQYKSNRAGQSVTCPRCHRAVSLPAVPEPPLLNPHPPAPAPSHVWQAAFRPTPPMQAQQGCMVMAMIAAVLCLAGSFAAVGTYTATATYSNRFQSDNAVGATANAVEHVAERGGWPTAGDMLVCSALLLIVAVLIGIHRQLERRA